MGSVMLLLQYIKLELPPCGCMPLPTSQVAVNIHVCPVFLFMDLESNNKAINNNISDITFMRMGQPKNIMPLPMAVA